MRIEKPTSLEKALDIALEREQYITEQEGLNPPRAPHRNQGQFQPHITVPETARVLTVTENKRKVCYTCDSTDHIRRHCPHQPAKYYCTHCNMDGHSWSHCIKVHGAEKIKNLKAEEKRARIERESKKSMNQENPTPTQQENKSKKTDLNGTGAPKSGGNKSAPIIIPPPPTASTSTQK